MVDQTLKVLDGRGSPVMDVKVGGCYHLGGRAGTFAVIQFNSAEDVLVMEMSTKVQETVSVRALRSISSSDNQRNLDLKLVDKQKVDAAKQRLEAITPLLFYKRLPSDVVESRAKETGVASKTLKKWVRRYRKDPRLSTLARKQRKDAGDTRLDPLVEKALEEAVSKLMLDGNLRIVDAHGDLEDRVADLSKKLGRKLTPPSYGTFYSRYLRISEREKAEAKLGKRPAKLKHGLQVGTMSDIDHPLALVQVDHLEIPVMVVSEDDRVPIHKAWITVLIDVFSRCVIGYYITLESPSNLSLGLAIAHAVLPKDETLKLSELSTTWPISGFMWAIHADNAGEFHGNMLELAANEYLIDLMYRKVRHPNYGAHIESYLGTLSDQLRRVPGSTREGPQALGDTEPSEEAVMTLDELERYVLSLILTYHHTPHSGIEGRTPLRKFEEGMRGGPGVIPVGNLRHPTDAAKFRLDFLPCDERVVQPQGIVWDYIWYRDDCLQRWVNAIDPNNQDEKRKFLVRRDPRDLSKIYFWDPEEKQYRVIQTANPSRPSMTIWELKAVKKFLKDSGVTEIDEEILFRGREERRKLLASAKLKTEAAKRQRARQEERDRRAKAGAAASSAAVVPQQFQSTSPLPNAPDLVATDEPGAAFTMDWAE